MTAQDAAALLAHDEDARIVDRWLRALDSFGPEGDVIVTKARRDAIRRLLNRAITSTPSAEAMREAAAGVEYTYEIGEAAEAYLKSVGGDPARLPGGFFWMEVWDAMRAASIRNLPLTAGTGEVK